MILVKAVAIYPVFHRRHTCISFGSHTIKRMLQLLLMHIYRHIGTTKMLQAARMVEMQVTHDHGLYVLDIVSRLCNGRLQLMVRTVVNPRKDVIDRRAPDLGVCFAGAGFEQNQAFGWMVN